MIIRYFRQIRKLVIINVHRERFLDLLFDVVVYHRVTLSGTGCTEHDGGTERIDDIYPTVPFLALIHELRGQVDGILVFHKPRLLHETLVGGVEHVLHQIVFQHTAYPYTRHQEKDIPYGKRYRIYCGIRYRTERQVKHPPVHEEQYQPG